MSNNNVLGIVYCNVSDDSLKELTPIRAIGSVPFGARYRLIDFTLSGLVNAGVSKVGLLTNNNYKSLADHVGSGRNWDLARKNGGLYILSPFSVSSQGVYKGRIDALHGAIDFLINSTEEYVVISNANVVTSSSIEEMVEKHISSEADITLAYKKDLETDNYLILDGDKVTDINSRKMLGSNNSYLDTIVINREKLIYLVNEASTHNYTNFTFDILQRKVDALDIRAFEVTSYAKVVTSIQSYYEANMDLLNGEIRRDLFFKRLPVYTKVRDEMPAKYGFDAKVDNSLIADGCVIEGEVKNSIIFRGVKIAKGARVENCIIMQSGVIGENTQLDYIIADKNVTFKDGRTLMGCRSFPMVIGKGLTV